MGRLTTRRPVTTVTVDGDTTAARRHADTLAVEEPLEIRIGGTAFSVTMRTPGDDVDLALGLLAAEGIVTGPNEVHGAIHCGGPGSGGEENTYNVLDLSLAPESVARAALRTRVLATTSACGVCGTASIEQLRVGSRFDVAGDAVSVSAAALAALPSSLRARQSVFAKTGGAHAAGLFDATSGELLAVREDVGRHNAVDKIVGWALRQDMLPLAGTVLQVSGRASFELAQKCVVAGIPVLSAVSAPSSLAVELADDAGLTLVGFVRDRSMNVYTRPDRIVL